MEEVGFILRADEYPASKAPRGGCHRDVILGNHDALLGEFGKNVGVILGSVGGERFDSGNPS